MTSFHPKTWIVCSGRTGSTLLTKIFMAMGANAGKAHNRDFEHKLLCLMNEVVILKMMNDLGIEHLRLWRESWMYACFPKGWFNWMWLNHHPALAAELKQAAPKLPQVLKDPRWSATLPFWLKHRIVWPNNILYFERPADQVAKSFAKVEGPHAQSVKKNLAYAKTAQTNLKAAVDAYEQQGVNVYRFNYPDYIENWRPMAQAVAECMLMDPGKAFEVAEEIIDPGKVHRYQGAGA
jgi:hypothetical protein